MSGVLAIGHHEREQIALALTAARAKPVPWAVMKDIALALAIARDTASLALKDRINSERIQAVRREYPSYRVKLGTYEAAISFEEQPAGMIKHLSVSSRATGKVPGEQVMRMVMEAFGFSGFPPHRGYRFWIEEFEPGHHAINFIEVEP